MWYNSSMTDLQKTILQKASGETRLDPDQQRLYMGTFRERVLLTISYSEAVSQDFQESFITICKELKISQSELFLKISPKLSDSHQIFFMKNARDEKIITTIVDENSSTSQFALIFHTDHALDIEDVSLAKRFPLLLQKKNLVDETPKTGFWKKLFGK